MSERPLDVGSLLTYLPHDVLAELTEVFRQGATKAGRYPLAWRDMPRSEALEKAMDAFSRHTAKDFTISDGGLSVDSESGCSHLAHRIANLVMELDLKRLKEQGK